MNKPHYPAIDGLRGAACIGIVMMHLRANGVYTFSGAAGRFFYDCVIAACTDFVFLFFLLSAFCLCCGYREEMRSGTLDLSRFYARRAARVWSFFALMVLAEVLVSPSRAAFYEAFADLTLLFGFLPQPGALQVVGVGWFLGLEAVFALCFPFFCVLLETKRRAWCAFAVSLAWNFACVRYFAVPRTNLLYSGCFFCAGGLLYLYRASLLACPRGVRFALAGASVALYFAFGGGTVACLLVSASLLLLALPGGGRLLGCRAPVRFGCLSFEIYLSHMAVFRVLERLGLLYPFGHGSASYIVVLLAVLAGSALFSCAAKRLLAEVGRKITTMRS